MAGLVCTAGLRAQDAQNVAEAARQEQARKAEKAKAPHHVYTDEDLKRAQILTPEDQAKVVARKTQATEKKEEQAKGSGESKPGEESLGEVARRYRKEKAEREAEEQAARAREQGDRSQFLMKMPEATMAAPKPLVQPKAEMRGAESSRRGMERRVSPFEPRPLRVAPSVTVVPRGAEEPSVPPSDAMKPKMTVAPRVPKAPSVPRETGTSGLSVKPEAVAPSVAMLTRKVERGDSWWKLAEMYLGNGARWRELRGMNASDGRAPEFLMLGSTVKVPAEIAARKAPVGKSVTVAEGDSLWRLARVHLGRGTAWKCLLEANPELGAPERLQVGQRILLPAGNACVAGVVKMAN